MRERPILFSAPMVRAILGGRKSQTRRIAKLDSAGRVARGGRSWHVDDKSAALACRYGRPRDLLWVRETWAETDRQDGTPVVAYRAGGCIAVGRDGAQGPDVLLRNFAWSETPYVDRWRSPIHMPRWASRILLEITGVRVERLQDINEAEALAEGVYAVQCNELGAEVAYYRSLFRPRDLYRLLWESINGRGSWDANPWVWVIEFRRIVPADHVPKAACP